MINKKFMLGAALAAAMALPAQADVLGVYVGAQAWQTDVDGAFSANNTSLVDFNFEEKTKTNFYVKFEHPVPLIPNARVRIGKLEGLGDASLGQDFSFGGVDYAANTSVNSSMDLTNNDATLYWEILDNDLIAFDIGLTAKNLDGDILVNNDSSSSVEEISVWLPMGYAAFKLRIPFAGVYAYGDANYVSYDGSDVHDYEVGVGYDIMDNLAVDMAITAGYREVAIELDDVDNINANVEFSGFFAGLEIHF